LFHPAGGSRQTDTGTPSGECDAAHLGSAFYLSKASNRTPLRNTKVTPALPGEYRTNIKVTPAFRGDYK